MAEIGAVNLGEIGAIRKRSRSETGPRDRSPCVTIYHLPTGFLSLRKEEPLPELSPQTPVSGYSWPRRTQVVDKAVSPSCFRSSLPSRAFSWCPLCHSCCPYVVFESCNVSRPSMYSLLDNVYDIIYTCLMPYTGITFVVA